MYNTQNNNTTQNENIWVGIYCRLSEEDDNKISPDDDSNSIKNQKEMLVNFALTQGWKIYDIYSDDNYKGSDRNRPEFNRLIEDCRKGAINVVLCKSQSRFTRELELVEKYIHGLFLIWGIRFIGLSDNADTDNKGNKKSRQINGLVNEWYLEDLSENIKSVYKMQREKGMFTGTQAPYGYKKSPDDIHKLVIDEEAAIVVRRIFTMVINRESFSNIARVLNSEGILSPSAYHRSKSKKTLLYTNGWDSTYISRMIRSEVYIGNMVQGKKVSPSYKVRLTQALPPNQWVKVENTHEPIIQKNIWLKANEIAGERYRPNYSKHSPSIYRGRLYCGVCGNRMCIVYGPKRYPTEDVEKTRAFRCRHQSQNRVICPKHNRIREKELNELLLSEIKKQIEKYFDAESINSLLKHTEAREKEQKDLKKQVTRLKTEIEELNTKLTSLYIDKSNGIIELDDYFIISRSIKTNIASKEQQKVNIDKRLEQLKVENCSVENIKELVTKYRNVTSIDIETLNELIKRIYVYPPGNGPRIAISWTF